jgi:3-hydroxyacyl-[acyl-carrier-protein] dehydratase
MIDGVLRASPVAGVDEVTVVAAGRLRGAKRITADSAYLAAHYPRRPIYPGVFVVESVLQSVEIGLGAGRLRLSTLRSLRLLAPVVPGDLLELDIEFERGATAGISVTAVARVAGVKTAQLSLELEGDGDVLPS